MSAPEEIDPERLEQLLAGAPPRDDRERAMVALIGEVRSVEPPASAKLGERIAALVDGAPAQRPGRLARLRAALSGAGAGDGRRRLLTVGAPIAVAALAAALVIPTVLDRGAGPSTGRLSAELVANSSHPADAAAPELRFDAAPEQMRSAPAAEAPPAAPAAAPADEAVPGGVPGAERGRSQQVTTWTRVRVDDVAALSQASTRAMAIVRAAGGHTASSEYQVPNAATGDNRLVFRVPTAAVDRVVAAFGDLGTVVGQDAKIEDVTMAIASGDTRIERARVRMMELQSQVARAPNDHSLRLRLTSARRELESLVAQQQSRADRAARAVVRLDLTTAAPPDEPQQQGPIAAAVDDSWDRLIGVFAWLIGALMLLGPPALVLALALVASRRVGRRQRHRLLDT